MFKVALVGHSHVPAELTVDVPAEVDIFRSPGAKIKSFFNNPLLTPVLQQKYHLIVLWLGSNDVRDNCNINDIVGQVKTVVEALEKTCGADVRFCLLEPRLTERQFPCRIDQESYIKVAKAVNRKLQAKVLKGRRCSSVLGLSPSGRTWGGTGYTSAGTKRKNL